MIAETTGGTTIGSSTKPTRAAVKRGWNIQTPRLKHSASTVEKALLTMPMRIESRMRLEPARVLDQRPVVAQRQFA